ncbi:MAG: hypothetical protein AAF614_11495 [Chloroflexota bacterium]
MNLIERYVKEVGRHLSSRQRKDVETELRSLLSDMVEDKAQTKLEQVDEEIIVETLREFGSPKEVAASYQPRPQYLIGPELFPIFKLVITIVPAVFIGVTVINILLSVTDSSNFLLAVTQPIVGAFPNLFQGIVMILGNVVLIFAILERVLPEEDMAEIKLGKNENWDPRKLYDLDETKPLNKPELVFGIVFTALALSALNFFPVLVGFILYIDDQLTLVSIFSDSFFNGVVPWINLIWLTSMVFKVMQLRIGERTRVVRWGEVGMSLLTAVLLIVAMNHQPLLALDPEAVYTGGTLNFVRGLETLVTTLNMLLRAGLPILLALQLYHAGKQVYDLWRSAGRTPTPKFA